MKRIQLKHIAFYIFMLLAFFGCQEEDPIIFEEDLLMITSELNFEVSEASGSASITVAISNPRSSNFSVPLLISDGTAVQGVDYSVSSSDVTFASGELETTFTFSIIDNDEQATEPKIFVISLPKDQGLRTTAEASSVTITILDDDLSCPVAIGGEYFAVTQGQTPFDGSYNNSSNPYPVTITDNEDGTYTFSDVTGGLYGELYASVYTDPGGTGTCNPLSGLAATLVRGDDCITIGATVPDHPGFVCWLGPNDMTVNGTINDKGEVTLEFENAAGDNGTVTLINKADFVFPPDDEPSCSVIGGKYLATTIGETPFDGNYDNSDNPYPVTITDNEDGTYTFSDVTGGLYGDLYAGIYTDPGGSGTCDPLSGLVATLVRDEDCITIGATVPDHPGFVCWLGPNDMTVNGSISDDGVITIEFENVAGDKGTVTLVEQPDNSLSCPVQIGGEYSATTIGSTPFNGDYNNTDNPYTVTITDNEDGTYTFSDVTGGLYGELYAEAFPDVDSNDCSALSGLEATLVRNEDCVSIGAIVPDHPGFVCRFGDNNMTVSGTISDDGAVTIEFENAAGDKGTVTFVKK